MPHGPWRPAIQHKAMVAKTHNPAPATAHDTPMYPRATISPTQANIYKAVIRHLRRDAASLSAMIPFSQIVHRRTVILRSLSKRPPGAAERNFLVERVEQPTDNKTSRCFATALTLK